MWTLISANKLEKPRWSENVTYFSVIVLGRDKILFERRATFAEMNIFMPPFRHHVFLSKLIYGKYKNECVLMQTCVWVCVFECVYTIVFCACAWEHACLCTCYLLSLAYIYKLIVESFYLAFSLLDTNSVKGKPHNLM